MSTKIKVWLGLWLVLTPPAVLEAQSVVSRFEGSVEKGVYESEYDALAYAESVGNDATVERVEGALVSRVFVKPEAKSNLEVFRSYERQLTAAGFTVRLAAESGSATELMARTLYTSPHTSGFNSREYRATDDRVSRIDLQRLGTQADYYLVASRTANGETRWVAVVLCRYEHLYMVEELTTTAMETGTVTLSIEAMRSEFEESGKIAVYDIHFATGSAVIQPESADALAVIASYLSETTGGFYIVGHTDDTGSLEHNLTLSQQRAGAVKDALIADHGVDASRLETRGVGPLAPVSNNTGDSGRALNRRVEIVQRLP
ncbi:MAG: OmpA family protein [Myxococcales bacterium]|nr:OmpA family protein [Myxococcales bacterium]